MAEPLYLELPRAPRSVRRRLPVLFLVLLVAVGAAVGWWFFSGRVSSVTARLDGMVHMVAPRFSGQLATLDVKAGDAVTAGQPVGTMETGSYDRQLAQAAAEAAALRPSQGPDMVESAARLRQAQEAERDLAVRMAQARHEEDTLRLLREERVTEHVRAQLEVRSLDSQGGERTAGARRYAAAREAEALARARKEAAIADFERVSLMRAAMEQELGRIREEITAARGRASQQRRAASGSAPGHLAADGTLFAPVNGTVLQRVAEPGQLLQAGEPALFIAPSGQAASDAFWVDAWFPVAAAGSIRAGQRCSVSVGDASLSGTVREVFPPQALPEALAPAPAPGGGGAASVRRPVAYLPVRVALDGDLPSGLAPGAAATCVVMTHGLPF